MQDGEEDLDRAQFEAARMLVARLLVETTSTTFEPEILGMDFAPLGDPVMAVTDEDIVIRGCDFVRAALVLLWSCVSTVAALTNGWTEADVIGSLGITLAKHAPTN